MVPYENAKSGASARAEIVKLLKKFGCQSVGFMDDFEAGIVLLVFKHRGRQIQIEVSSKGWAAMYLKENPWSPRRRTQRREYERKAIEQGLIAVNSILRDWIKGQLTAVECGIMPFEAVFMPYAIMPDGRSVLDHVMSGKLLPPPTSME